MQEQRITLPFLGLLLFGLPMLSYCSIIVDEEETDCGNEEVEGLEECDSWNFGDQDCASQGFDGGHLICTPYCRILTWNCHDSNCGNQFCDDDENQASCPGDCPEGPVCGDDKCDVGEQSTCEDCVDVWCGDGYCSRPTEDASCAADCQSAFYCGDGICHSWEWDMGGCERDCSGLNCDNNGVCEPDRHEPENQCADCSELPACGSGTCEAPDETVDNCPYDCVPRQCGDDQIQLGEICDGHAFFGVQGACYDFASRAGPAFEGGTLRCNADCFVDTWECLPKDLGAACDSTDDCLNAAFNGVECHIGGGGQGVCTLPCSVEGAPCGPSGASCHDVSGNLDFLCLWPCTQSGEQSCDPRLLCQQFPMETGAWFCAPSDS